MKNVIASVIIFTLVFWQLREIGNVIASGNVVQTTITILNCKKGFDKFDYCLANDAALAVDMDVFVNVKQNTILKRVRQTDGNFWIGDYYIKDCDFIDELNWSCTKGKDIQSGTSMSGGHFIMSLTGGSPPNYYHSSLSGWKRFAVNMNIMGLSTAMNCSRWLFCLPYDDSGWREVGL